MPLTMLLIAAATAAIDYRDGATWLCRPGRRDVCSSDITATIVSPDGTMRAVPVANGRRRDTDCFYVYPTVSLDPGDNSDMHADREERDMTQAHLAPFRQVCRTFAPIYRQVTLTALRKALDGRPIPGDFQAAYADVRAAWHDYLTHDNQRRPFVLIGHSQGSAMLKRLVAEEIDGKPIQRRMLSAILPGTSVEVPRGRRVGGDFKALPLCRAETQTGCIVTWASYRDTARLPANARFGRAGDPAMTAGCTNPASLAGGVKPLDPIFGSPWWKGGVALYRQPDTGWSFGANPLKTRYVRMPGLLSGECVERDGASFLAVRVAARAAQPLADTVAGTAAIGDLAYPDWGLHVVDIEIVQRDLIHLVGRQRAAYRAREHARRIARDRHLHAPLMIGISPTNFASQHGPP